MSLSKKSLDKLNAFVKDKNLVDDKKKFTTNNKDLNQKVVKDFSKQQDPSSIFYSLIDNSETLIETSEVNQLLRKSEKDFNSINSKESNSKGYLTSEEELYDEFNYFLEE